jgi:hypothetical protein
VDEKSKRLYEDLLCVEAFLIDEHDIYVDYDGGGLDEYWFDPDDPSDPGIISIKDTHSDALQLIILLHEAGHVVYRHKNNKARTKIPRETVEDKMAVLEEEVMAWYEGYKLSEQLGVIIDPELFEHNYSSSLVKYIKWVMFETEEN